jgi:hypothetical protein
MPAKYLIEILRRKATSGNQNAPGARRKGGLMLLSSSAPGGELAVPKSRAARAWQMECPRDGRRLESQVATPFVFTCEARTVP